MLLASFDPPQPGYFPMGPGQLEILAPMVFAVILTLTIGGVILLKPIANKL